MRRLTTALAVMAASTALTATAGTGVAATGRR